jgi:1-acyl-sn-glycerol-3-phosphate acyltransferase
MAEPRPGEHAHTRLGPPAAWELALYRFVRFLIRVVAPVIGRIRVEGAERIPRDTPYVLAPVHRSNVDFALVSLVDRRRIRYMGKDSIWKSRALGRFVSALGAFPVHRGSADREALRTCIEVIRAGEPLVVFPEGTRRRGAVVEDLFDGPAYIAVKTGVPVVPVGIGGSERMLPKGAKFLHPTRLLVLVGDPIPAPTAPPGGRVPRGAVRQLTERIGADIQAHFDEAQRRTDSTKPPGPTHGHLRSRTPRARASRAVSPYRATPTASSVRERATLWTPAAMPEAATASSLTSTVTW